MRWSNLKYIQDRRLGVLRPVGIREHSLDTKDLCRSGGPASGVWIQWTLIPQIFTFMDQDGSCQQCKLRQKLQQIISLVFTTVYVDSVRRGFITSEPTFSHCHVWTQLGSPGLNPRSNAMGEIIRSRCS